VLDFPQGWTGFEWREQMMFRLSRTQLLGSFLLLAIILCLLVFRYLRILWWTP
jgi:hypothetical protein